MTDKNTTKNVTNKTSPKKQSKVKNKRVKKKTEPGESTNKKAESKAQIKKSNKKTDNVLRLDPVLVINDAKKIYSQLEKLLNSKGNIVIDASAVEIVDTAVSQLFLAFANKLRDLGTQIEWAGLSEEFTCRTDLLGLTERLWISGKAANAD